MYKKKQLQLLLGCLLYIIKCVRHSRPFLNRMSDLLRSHFGKDYIQLDIYFHRNLNWVQTFLPQFNDEAFFVHCSVQATIELDACLQGLGAAYMNQVYVVPIPEYCHNFSVVHLEMLNILVTIRVWCQYWSNRLTIIKCEYQAVVSVLNSDKTQGMNLAAITWTS